MPSCLTRAQFVVLCECQFVWYLERGLERKATTHMTKPRVGVVGAGRVGAVLAARFERAHYPVVGISARSQTSLARAQALVPQVAISNPEQIVRSADVVVLAVPDGVLNHVVEEISPVVRAGQVVFHVSGRHGRSVLAPLETQGVITMALHPAMTFTGTELDVERACAFGVTAPAEAHALAESIVVALGGTVVEIAETDRIAYHAALAHGSNHVTTVINQALDTLRHVGASEPAAVLRPLVEAAVSNTLALGDQALTGPVLRGDVDTVEAHLAAFDDPETRATYFALARATSGRAQRMGALDEAAGAKLDSVLTQRSIEMEAGR